MPSKTPHECTTKSYETAKIRVSVAFVANTMERFIGSRLTTLEAAAS